MEGYVYEGFPEVFPVGLKGFFLICQQVFFFGFDDLFEAVWQVGIVWRYESGAEFASEPEQLIGVQALKLFAQRAYSHKLKVSFKKVIYHGQLIYPELAHKPSRACDPEVVFELAALIEPVLFIDILLQVFGKGVHSTELIDTYYFSVLTCSYHGEEHPVRWFGVECGFAGFAHGKKVQKAYGLLFNNFKSARVKTPQGLCMAYYPVSAAGKLEIYLLGDGQLGHDPFQNIIGHKYDEVYHPRIFIQQLFIPQLKGFGASYENARLRQLAVYMLEKLVYAAYVIYPVEVYQGFDAAAGYLFYTENFGGRQNMCLVRIKVSILSYEMIYFLVVMAGD